MRTPKAATHVMLSVGLSAPWRRHALGNAMWGLMLNAYADSVLHSQHICRRVDILHASISGFNIEADMRVVKY